MSLILVRRQNYRLIQLDETSPRSNSIGVLLASGEYRYVTWLGFISREAALRVGQPVKLEVARIGVVRGINTEWIDLPKGKHIQGCLVYEGAHAGAYAIVEQAARIID